MQIWILALAWRQIEPDPALPAIPRRLAWVVNRRVVVDQATEEAARIAREVAKLPAGDPLRDALETLSGNDGLLAVSTLRGEKADNRQWSANPARPAIIVGTVDMIGSRLLFRGYGDSRYRRPIHAGLLGVDTLIVNDEAHLSPAFANLLQRIESLSPAAALAPKSFRVLRLSATPDGGGTAPLPNALETDLVRSERFRAVYTAPKRLHLLDAANGKELESRLFELATQDPAPRTIIFVEQPEEAAKMAERIRTATRSEKVVLLTGTMRGRERDDLAARPVFRAFTGELPPAEPHWLVATSAAEVGVNITSERLCSALVESDHLVQRFGRLNRFPVPGSPPAEAWVIALPAGKEPRLAATLAYLRSLPLSGDAIDISCRTLYESPAPEDSRSPLPIEAPEPLPRLLDLWSQTSATTAAMPPVAWWLHGKPEDEWPETEVAWREDVAWLAREDVSDEDRERALEYYPVIPRERLSEPSTRVLKKLAEIAAARPGTRAILVSADGSVSACELEELADPDRRLLLNARLLLPDGCGSLSDGMFRPQPPGDADQLYDIADEREKPGRRYLSRRDEGGDWTTQRLGLNGTPEPPPAFDPEDAAELARFAAANGLAPPLRVPIPAGEDQPPDYLLYFKAAPEKKPAVEVLLAPHLEAVAAKAAGLAKQLGLNGLAETFCAAGYHHDAGKRHELWQRAMGGSMAKPLAKSRAAPAPALLAGFRHELNSLVSEAGIPDELALHLVASHHGWARPHFEAKAWPREKFSQSAEAALCAARRFAELQAQWGHWGLAYLEAVFKAADSLVSAAEQGGADA